MVRAELSSIRNTDNSISQATPSNRIHQQQGDVVGNTALKDHLLVRHGDRQVQDAIQKAFILDDEMLDSAVDDLNKTMEVLDRSLQFSIHEGTNRVMVRVVDPSNDDEVIREIPPEKILDMMAEIKDAIGLLIDEKV